MGESHHSASRKDLSALAHPRLARGRSSEVMSTRASRALNTGELTGVERGDAAAQQGQGQGQNRQGPLEDRRPNPTRTLTREHPQRGAPSEPPHHICMMVARGSPRDARRDERAGPSSQTTDCRTQNAKTQGTSPPARARTAGPHHDRSARQRNPTKRNRQDNSPDT